METMRSVRWRSLGESVSSRLVTAYPRDEPGLRDPVSSLPESERLRFPKDEVEGELADWAAALLFFELF
jgi:hypothetical protein